MLKILLAGDIVCKTNRGPDANKRCVFPFTYDGIPYNHCTHAGGEGKPWCATQTNAQGGYIDGKWGYCSPGCPDEETHRKFILERI